MSQESLHVLDKRVVAFWEKMTFEDKEVMKLKAQVKKLTFARKKTLINKGLYSLKSIKKPVYHLHAVFSVF